MTLTKGVLVDPQSKVTILASRISRRRKGALSNLAGIKLHYGRLVTETSGMPEAQIEFTIVHGGQVTGTFAGPHALASETQRLQMLNEISRALSSRLDLHDVYETIYEQVSRVMDTSMFFLALRHKDREQVHLAYLREYGALSVDVNTPAGRSVTAHVLGMGQPLMFHTAEQYEEYAIAHGLPVIVMGDESRGASNSMIFAPLNTGSETIGALSVQSHREYAYTQNDLDALTVIASQAAVAVQNATLYEASLESTRRRQALIRVAETVTGSLEIESVLNAILDGIREVLPYYLAAIMLPDSKSGELVAVGSVGDLPDRRRAEIKIDPGEGVTGKVFESGEAIVVQDVATFDGYVAALQAVKSEVAVPLKRGEAILGVLNVERSEKDAFPAEDVELLCLFATQAAIAIENARLFEDQRNRILQMQAIQSIVKDMTMVNENDAMASAIERGLHKLIDYDECIIYLVSDDGTELLPIMTAVGPNGRLRDRRIPKVPRKRNEGFAGWCWSRGESSIFNSSRTDPRTAPDLRAANIEVCVMGAPMMYQGRVSGVITVGKEGADFYSEDALPDLELVAGHAAIGFDRCRLYAELQLQATTDDLTGLFNRRYFSRRLGEEKSRALRNNHPLAAVMVDADDFKHINDSFGHDTGDDVLRGLANLLKAELRTEDIVARYGGEEFLILLPEVDSEGAVAVADRLRRLVASTQLTLDPQLPHLQISVGVSLLESNDVTEDLTSRADQAMYEAKRNGGNMVCLADGTSFTLVGRRRTRRIERNVA